MQLSLLTGESQPADSGHRADQLRIADPDQWLVDSSWEGVKKVFFGSAQGQELCARLQLRLDKGAVIFPPEPLRALSLTALRDVRVVILGQDPYHARGQAEGLAFSVSRGVAVPPSLRNIFKELMREGDAAGTLFPVTEGSLLSWAQRGVLLLNTCLTVEEAQPASHSKWGWEVFTDMVIREVSDRAPDVVFMLWGAHAQAKQSLIDPEKHLVLCANHPSPLSASRPPVPFIGCGHFSQASRWLKDRTRD
ncbi:Uracil-DNA glycosylase [Curvibacter sp. AEP1-3]|uniref:uracil-DNA glycosylase n=1 Tax=Curvibacter sp. AEP1-3 TaxID=1844971 RepID=UPI000B3C0C23|nr:uracil-DNA glycosylase [Curvibacter sp. AEP1-3]ARV18992.1 Uracil-DNA glycosylase [Curvibacter sp. AEP1-3]